MMCLLDAVVMMCLLDAVVLMLLIIARDLCIRFGQQKQRAKGVKKELFHVMHLEHPEYRLKKRS